MKFIKERKLISEMQELLRERATHLDALEDIDLTFQKKADTLLELSQSTQKPPPEPVRSSATFTAAKDTERAIRRRFARMPWFIDTGVDSENFEQFQVRLLTTEDIVKHLPYHMLAAPITLSVLDTDAIVRAREIGLIESFSLLVHRCQPMSDERLTRALYPGLTPDQTYQRLRMLAAKASHQGKIRLSDDQSHYVPASPPFTERPLVLPNGTIVVQDARCTTT